LHWPNKARRDSFLGRSEIELRYNALEQIERYRKAQEVVASTKVAGYMGVSPPDTASSDIADTKGSDVKDTPLPATEVERERRRYISLPVMLVVGLSLAYATMQMHKIKWQDLFQHIQRVGGQPDSPFQKKIETKEPIIGPHLPGSPTKDNRVETQPTSRHMDGLSIGPHLSTSHMDEFVVGP
jgi:hypothetical protein